MEYKPLTSANNKRRTKSRNPKINITRPRGNTKRDQYSEYGINVKTDQFKMSLNKKEIIFYEIA